MTPTAPTTALRARPRPRLTDVARWPWWVRVLAVYLGARALSAVVILAVARTQAANLWTSASPSYTEYTGLMWDATWYREIAERGYPDELPVGFDGHARQSALAFFPLFPSLARGLMEVTGWSWEVAGPTLALALGVAAALVVHQVVAAAVGPDSLRAAWSPRPAWWERTGPGAGRVRRALPLASVTVLALWGAAPVLQVGYTESLALLLLAAAVLCLQRRLYLTAVPVVLGLGLTRAVALPFAVAVAAHAVARLRAQRREEDAFGLAERVSLGVLAAASAVAGVLWPALVARMTGVPDAYEQTQAAWRARGAVVPLLPWLDVARWWAPGWWPVLLLGELAAAVGVVVASRRLGPELQGWTAGYLAYLALVIEPGTSLIRFLVLAFPGAAVAAAWALAARRSRWWFAALVLVGVASQVAWVACIWRLVPPQGWPP